MINIDKFLIEQNKKWVFKTSCSEHSDTSENVESIVSDMIAEKYGKDKDEDGEDE